MTDLCGIKMYSPKELKEMFGFGKNKVYELLKDGLIEYVDFKGKMMITEEQIKKAISNLTVRKIAPKLYPKR
jgi:predicted site-specific integrase-resolvase